MKKIDPVEAALIVILVAIVIIAAYMVLQPLTGF